MPILWEIIESRDTVLAFVCSKYKRDQGPCNVMSAGVVLGRIVGLLLLALTTTAIVSGLVRFYLFTGVLAPEFWTPDGIFAR